jgi:hypothetical protein
MFPRESNPLSLEITAMNLSDYYGITLGGLGYVSYSTGTGIIFTYPQSNFIWSFYEGPLTPGVGGPGPRLASALNEASIDFNSEFYGMATGSITQGPWNCNNK